MRAEIISVGTELLLGHTVNSDATHIARELAAHGIALGNVQTVGDDPETLRQALSLAASRSDLIVTSGGLGPTADDLTKETAASFAGVELVEDQDSLRRLKEFFAGRKMSANQLKQSFVPAGSVVLANENGTAPGCVISLADGKKIMLLPGPPRELLPMLENQARPYFASLSGNIIHSEIIRTFGIGEGSAAELIRDLMDSDNPAVAPYASFGEMFVKITARADNIEKAKELCRPVKEEIRARLGDFVYGENVASLEEVVVREMIGRGMSVAAAESCTGGLLAKRITDQPGASAVFRAGVVSYSNAAKESLLNVPAETLEKYGAVSAQTAEAMARGARALAQADIGLGVTGIAGPDGATPQKPLGLVYIALAAENDCFLRVVPGGGKYRGREWVRCCAASSALDLTRRFLFGLPMNRSPQ